MNETLKHILDNNPGLVNIILTGVFLPLGILWLTNRNNRQLGDTTYLNPLLPWSLDPLIPV